MGKVIMSGIVPLLSAPSTTEPNFADNTWAQIIKACQTNRVPDTWAVGNQKTMAIGGTDYVIDIIGKGHDDYADGSGKAPLTFQLHDCYGELKSMKNAYSNVGGWTSCDMRQTHLPAILVQMPTEVQSGIREVNKLTSAGNQSEVINTTADKLFLLSEVEVWGGIEYSVRGEGTQYAYYKEGHSKVKNYNGNANYWWERSPATSLGTFCYVHSDGKRRGSIGAYEALGVAFAFCF